MTGPRVTADDLAGLRERARIADEAGCLPAIAGRYWLALLDEIDRRGRERDALRTDCAGCLTWDTTCRNCAKTWDACYAETIRRESAERDLAAAQTQIAAVRALCDDYRANCDPKSVQARVAELFRAALAEGPAPEGTT